MDQAELEDQILFGKQQERGPDPDLVRHDYGADPGLLQMESKTGMLPDPDAQTAPGDPHGPAMAL